MPDPARIAQAQVLEIPVTVQGEKAVDETGAREPFAESAKTTLTFDNGAVLKLQARMKAGESVSLRNEQSGKEIQCKVLEAPPEGQMGYTDLEFVESMPDFWEGHAEQAEAAGEKVDVGAAKSDAESAAEEPEPAAAVAEPDGSAKAEPAAEKQEPAEPEALAANAEPKTEQPAAAVETEAAVNAEPAAEKPEPAPVAAPEAVAAVPEPAAAQAEANANEPTEAAADNSLAMMSAAASEASLPPVKAPASEEKPEERKSEAQKPQGRFREELVPAHEMVPVPEVPRAPASLTAPPPVPSATVPTGEQIDAALRRMEAALASQDAAEPNDAKDQANLAALISREARLAKYAALKEKAASQIGRSPAPQVKSKGAEAAEGEAGASVEGELEAEAGPPKAPLVERLTTGRNLIVSEIVVGLAIVVALGFVWHAVRGLFIHPRYRPVAAAAPVRKAVPPKALPVVAQTPAAVQTPAAPVAKVQAATPSASGNARAAKATAAAPTVATSAPVAKAPAVTSSAPVHTAAAGGTAARPAVVASAPAAKIVQPASPRSEPVEDDGPRVVEPPPVSEEAGPEAPVAPKVPKNVAAQILSAPQPGFPRWAKKLDVGSVVKLDAVIDEKGNLGQMKIVSGPRLLERAAEQAVQLWIFEPAQLNGKPAASHMILTVEFQR